MKVNLFSIEAESEWPKFSLSVIEFEGVVSRSLFDIVLTSYLFRVNLFWFLTFEAYREDDDSILYTFELEGLFKFERCRKSNGQSGSPIK